MQNHGPDRYDEDTAYRTGPVYESFCASQRITDTTPSHQTTHQPRQSARNKSNASHDLSRYTSFYASGHSNLQVGDVYTNNHIVSQGEEPTNLLKTLSFPQIHNRVHQVQDASPETYQWLLSSEQSGKGSAHSFRTWLQDIGDRRIFWISGKPGSGKSTLLKLICEDPAIDIFLTLEIKDTEVLRLNHFFWIGGNHLQKSVEGFLRNIIVQILERYPSMREHIESSLGFSSLSHQTTWPVKKLRQSLHEIFQGALSNVLVFLAVDGLDECGTSIQEHDMVLRIFSELSTLPNMSICVSSRPYNKFEDFFQACPQIQLEDLTHGDIMRFVTSAFQDCRRWRILARLDSGLADALVNDILARADGVFLWTGLVIRDMVQILEDGGNFFDLQRCLTDVPLDLESYFGHILESIPLSMRSEASFLLQLALFEEDQFVSLWKFNLMDLVCLDLVAQQRTSGRAHERGLLVVLYEEKMRWQVDSALRKLSSRCKGLLECVERFKSSPTGVYIPADFNTWKRYAAHDATVKQFLDYTKWLESVVDTAVVPLHRSFRDFLMLPSTKELLIEYNHGKTIDPRLELVDARTLQLMAFHSIGAYVDRVVGTTSYILSALSVYGQDKETINRASILASLVETMSTESAESYWYIQRSLDAWQTERSQFITIAIDFRLTSYVIVHLTPEIVARKPGRPILDYILRPRFGTEHNAKIFRKPPDIDMLSSALRSGADPNEPIDEHGSTIWARFLCFLMDVVSPREEISDIEKTAWVQVVKTLINVGAPTSLPRRWLNETNSRMPLWGRSPDAYQLSSVLSDTDASLENYHEEYRSVTEYLGQLPNIFSPETLQNLDR